MVRAADRAKNPAQTSIWLSSGKPPRDRRTGQPAGLDRDRIVATSIRLLDTEGLAKFSMRRLAAELNVTAMSVYWYVDTKDDIFELALDAVFGEVEVADAGDAPDWRTEMRQLAKSYRGIMVRHPWVSSIMGNYLNIGPHAMVFAHAVQRVVRDTGIPPEGQPGVISAVFQFVYGFGTSEGHFKRRCAESGMTEDEYYAHAMAAFGEEPGFEETLENMKEILDLRSRDTVQRMWEKDFLFALDVLIAGIDATVARYSAQS
ncbi:TetR/AcrR family transcriptional regulator [Streptomyces sp. T-3]|nr:TetR/AcrR family transcriptional regulator [Streptomyces sp. T-3]